MHDLRGLQHAGAVFAPAIQSDYTAFVGLNRDDELRPPGLTRRVLDVFNPASPLLQLRTVLVSAIDRMKPRANCMIEGRDRDLGSIVIMDSGGFSIIHAGFVPEPNTARRTLRRQEPVADIAVTLDVPTQAIDKKVPAFDTFDKCLAATLGYLADYARFRRSSRLILLNVLQGRTPQECDRWYDAVKQFQFEGWACAGKLRLYFSLVLRRILQMLDEHQLDRCQWMHFLGTGRLDVAVILTAMQDGLRAVLGRPALTVSFDDSMTAVNIRNRQTGHFSADITKDACKWIIGRFPNHLDYVGRITPYPLSNSPLARRLRWGDICARPVRGSTWDLESLALLENHVMYVRAAALGEVALRSMLYPAEAVQFMPAHLVALRQVVIEVITTGRHDLIGR